MKKFLFISILNLLISNLAFAQQSKFDSIFNVISLETIRMEWAVNVADSLYKNAETDQQKIRSSMLSASLLHKTGITNEAILHAKRADELAEKSNNYDLQARVCGLMSTIYREAKLPVEGKIYLEKALKASKKINDKDNSNKFQGNLHQEMAYYAMDEKNPAEAVRILLKGKGFFESLSDSKQRNFLLATNEELLAKNYLELTQYSKALSTYEMALKHLGNSGQESALIGFIYNGMGKVYLAEENNENAIEYLQKALKVAEDSQFVALKDEVYQSLMNYYKKIHDQENYVKFNEKYIALRNEYENTHNASSEHVIKELYNKQRSAIFNLYTIIGISIALICLAFGLYLYMRIRRNKEIKQFKLLIEELNNKSQNKKEHPKVLEVNEHKELIPVETEQKILERLEGFENSTKFLNKGFTLPMLAIELETNTKYLSHIIKKHKNSDFNTYINKLRIDYIITKLHDNPIYSSYKISYLADECGFSSHSKFTTVFKNVTGVSPTVFLSLMAENSRKKE